MSDDANNDFKSSKNTQKEYPKQYYKTSNSGQIQQKREKPAVDEDEEEKIDVTNFVSAISTVTFDRDQSTLLIANEDEEKCSQIDIQQVSIIDPPSV